MCTYNSKQIYLLAFIIIFFFKIILFYIFTVKCTAELVYFPILNVTVFFYFDYHNLLGMLGSSTSICILVLYMINNVSAEIFQACVARLSILSGLIDVLCCSTNLIVLYLVYEISMLLLFSIICLLRKCKAWQFITPFFLSYTAGISVVTLFLLVLFYTHVKSVDYYVFILVCENYFHSINISLWFVWILFTVVFLVKLPIMPFYLWLPEIYAGVSRILGFILVGNIILRITLKSVVLEMLDSVAAVKFESFKPLVCFFFLVSLILWIQLLLILTIIFIEKNFKKFVTQLVLIHSFVGLCIYLIYLVGGGVNLFIVCFHIFISLFLLLLMDIVYSYFWIRWLKHYLGVNKKIPKWSIFTLLSGKLWFL